MALDTNVVISALLFPSELMDEVFRISSAPGNRLVLSNYVVDETVDVIGRKWPDMVGAAVAFIALLDFDPADDGADADPNVAIRDPEDLPVIIGAVRGRCDVLVTGDRDFEDVNIDVPVIMTPREFVDAFGGA